MAATGETDDPAFPVGAACRIDSRSPWRQIAEIPVGLDPEGIAIDVGAGGAPSSRARAATSSRSSTSRRTRSSREIATGTEPIDIGFDEQTGRVFSADAHADQVTIIDAETLEVETTVPVGGYPSGLTHVPEYAPPLRRQLARLDDERDRPRHARDGRDASTRSRAPARSASTRRATSPSASTSSRRRRTSSTPTRSRRSGGSSSGSAPARSASSPSAARRSSSTRSPARSRASTSTRSRSWRRSAPVRRPSGSTVASVARPRLRHEPRRRLAHRDRRRRRRRSGRRSPSATGPAASPSTRTTAGSSSRTPGARRCRSSRTCSPARPPVPVVDEPSPWIGKRLPEFSLEDYWTGERRTNADWAEKKYILNFFASW